MDTFHAVQLPVELPNDLRFMILRNYEVSGKSWNCMKSKPCVKFSSQNGNVLNTREKLLKTKYWTFPVVH